MNNDNDRGDWLFRWALVAIFAWSVLAFYIAFLVSKP